MTARSVATTTSLLSVLALAVAMTGGRLGAQSADEAAIRAQAAAWNKSAVAKNANQFASFYTADANLLPPGAPMASGIDAIRKAVTGLMASPGFSLTFGPDKITVNGKLAYEIGHYTEIVNDKDGKPQTANGKYVVVWAKQSDGSWKAVLDAPTTTQ
jgi:uncharacterized protein (TIGR02246 family)